MNWIELKEAVQLVDRSRATLKRALNKHGIEHGQPIDQSIDQFLIYKKKPAPKGFYWYITKESLFKYFNLIEHIEPDIEPDIEQQHPIDNTMTIQLNDRVQSLESEIDRLHKIISEKDRQIEMLYTLLQQQQPKPIEHKPNKPTGIFSKVLVKFGL